MHSMLEQRNSFLSQCILKQSISSVPSWQSTTWSHFLAIGKQDWFGTHSISVLGSHSLQFFSSDPSWQSSAPLQYKCNDMHLPLLHLKSKKSHVDSVMWKYKNTYVRLNTNWYSITWSYWRWKLWFQMKWRQENNYVFMW